MEIAVVLFAVIALVFLLKKDKSNPEPEPVPSREPILLMTPVNDSTRATEFFFDPQAGLTNNVPHGQKGYAFVSRYTGSEKDYNIFDEEYTSRIDTRKFPYQSILGGGPQRILQIDTQGIPLFDNGELVYSFDVSVSKFEGTGVGQVTFFAYISDKNGKVFAFVLNCWDNRYTDFAPTVMHDHQVAFATSPAKTTKYVTVLDGDMRMVPHTTYNNIKFKFTEQNIRNIVEDLNGFTPKDGFKFDKFDTDVVGMKVGLVGILHETFLLDDPKKYVNQEVHMRGIKIEREPK